ncbi:MAG: penicillin-binding protein 2 [Patescibacteria group bacterium]
MRLSTRRQPLLEASNVFQRGRFEIMYYLIVVVFLIIIVRLFYLQVIMHKDYKDRAFSGQYKEQQILPRRGTIDAFDGTTRVPFVLNEDTYTLFVDPKYIKEKDRTSEKLAKILGVNSKEIKEKINNSETRYVVIAKRVDQKKKDQIEDLNLVGVGLRTVPMRSYPNGNLASQLLGYVDQEGSGKYGIEQYMDGDLKGEIGLLKAVTDAKGVPLINNKDNVLKDAKDGKKILLTIDVGLQKKVEDTLRDYLPTVNSKSGSVLVMDPNTGAIKAMANFPTYNPAEYFKVEDPRLFQNATVADPFEVGSIMKTLTMSAGINEGVVNLGGSYVDQGVMKIGDREVKNVSGFQNRATRPITDIITLSLNTGAVYILQQLGGGELNEQGRVRWHNYLVNHYRFSKTTGVEQGYEAEGYVPDPKNGFGLNIDYANTTFGQGMNITQLQMTSALSAVINGGTYYQPHLVASTKEGKANVDDRVKVVAKDVVKPETSSQIKGVMELAVNKSYTFLKRDGYIVGGKTGTAQIAKPGGGYYDDSKINGTFIGYIGITKPEYVIMVRVNEPVVPGYAGSKAAAPLFGRVSNTLMDNYLLSKTN